MPARWTFPYARASSLRISALLVMAMLVAACSPGSSATPTSSVPAGSPLPAGTYTSKAFKPALTFTLPGGWENPEDSATYLELRPLGDEVVGIHVFRDPVALSQASTCPLAAEPGVGPTSLDLVKWIRDRPGFVVSQPGLVKLGGLQGTVIDIGIVAGWKESCPFAKGLPTVPLFFQPPNGYHWVIAGSERLRLYILDLPGGGLVVVDIDAFDGTRIDGLLTAAGPIVKSFSFAVAP